MTAEPNEIVVVREQAPALAGFATASPALTLQRGKAVADAAAPVIKDLGLVKRIHQSFHVYFDGWTMVGAMVGVFPITTDVWEIGQDEGYGAKVEARTLAGQVVGCATAVVMRDEEVGGKQKWLEAPRFQVESMCQTRAGGKALRQPLGWIMRLAGYEATPAEEMDEAAAARGETVSGGKGVRAGWRDIGEQNNAHQRLNVFVANNGLGEWVATWLASKGYERPMSKAQMADLRRAVDRELEERKEEAVEQMHESSRQPSDPGNTPAPQRHPGSDLTSEGDTASASHAHHTRRGQAASEPVRGPRGDGAPSDQNASAEDPGGNDATQAGREPSKAEAPTSPPPPASPGDSGDHLFGAGEAPTGEGGTEPAPNTTRRRP